MYDSRDFRLGVHRALSAAGKCGTAFPHKRPDDEYTACVKQRGHTGMHDDLFHPGWGSKWATAEENLQQGSESWQRAHAGLDSRL